MIKHKLTNNKPPPTGKVYHNPFLLQSTFSMDMLSFCKRKGPLFSGRPCILHAECPVFNPWLLQLKKESENHSRGRDPGKPKQTTIRRWPVWWLPHTTGLQPLKSLTTAHAVWGWWKLQSKDIWRNHSNIRHIWLKMLLKAIGLKLNTPNLLEWCHCHTNNLLPV